MSQNSQNIEDIINGDTIVGEAVRAIEDEMGNNISNTYLTKVLGATKQYVRDYAQPREFSNIYFISNAGYSSKVPETPASGIQFSTITNAVGNFTLFELQKTSTVQFEISSINGYSNILQISASKDCSVAFRLTTQYKKQGQDWQNLNIELTNQISLTSGDIQKIALNSPFLSLGDNVLSLEVGDIIRQKLEIVSQTSEIITFDLYCNEIYPSTFTFTSQNYTLAYIDQIKGQTIFMGVDGVIEANRVVFEVQNADSFIEYRTNQREFLITGLLPLVGTLDPTLPVAITFGDTTYNVYSFFKSTNSPITIGDLMSVSKHSLDVGYLFYSKMIFVKTSDIEGFVLSPANITANQLLELLDNTDTMMVSLDNSGTKISLNISTAILNKINRALLTPVSAPSEREFVGINTNNEQIMIPESEINNKINSKSICYKYIGSGVIEISDSLLTTKEDYMDFFNLDPYKIYKVYQPGGSSPTTNFANLVGDPFGTNPYRFYLIKEFVNGQRNRYGYQQYEIYCFTTGGLYAKRYLMSDSVNNVFLNGGWIKGA